MSFFKRVILTVVSCLIVFSSSVFANPDATDIVRQADEHLRGKTNLSELTMSVHQDTSKEMALIEARTPKKDASSSETDHKNKDRVDREPD